MVLRPGLTLVPQVMGSCSTIELAFLSAVSEERQFEGPRHETFNSNIFKERYRRIHTQGAIQTRINNTVSFDTTST